MKRNAFRLLKPLRVIPLGPQRETQLEELPSGAQVGILREFVLSGCIDITYGHERYFALKSEMVCHAEDQRMSLSRFPQKDRKSRLAAAYRNRLRNTGSK